MTIESAEAEYTRLKAMEHTPEELWAGWKVLCEVMDKLRMERNNLCDNDEQDGDVWP